MRSPVQIIVRVRVSQADLAAILYSSGTTGRVKGVMLTHRNLMATVSGRDGPRYKAKGARAPPGPKKKNF